MSELMTRLLRAGSLLSDRWQYTPHECSISKAWSQKDFLFLTYLKKWVQHTVLSALRLLYVLTFAPSPSFLHQFLTPQQALPVKGARENWSTRG